MLLRRKQRLAVPGLRFAKRSRHLPCLVGTELEKKSRQRLEASMPKPGLVTVITALGELPVNAFYGLSVG